MKKEFIIDGNNFNDLEGFFCEIDSLLTKNLDWKTGHNLDAFNDILAGGFNVHELGESIRIIWKNHNKSRKDLGYKATISYYEYILKVCHPTAKAKVNDILENLKLCNGDTLFDIIVKIIIEKENVGHDCELIFVEYDTNINMIEYKILCPCGKGYIIRKKYLFENGYQGSTELECNICSEKYKLKHFKLNDGSRPLRYLIRVEDLEHFCYIIDSVKNIVENYPNAIGPIYFGNNE